MKTQVNSDKGQSARTGLAATAAAMTVPTGMTLDPSLSAVDDDGTSPGGHIYEHLGFLIIEGRCAAVATAKGRRERAAHYPQAAALPGAAGCCKPYLHHHHQCCDGSQECSRAQAYRKEMATMWCNGIPLCIEALLCVACELDDDDAGSTPGGHLGASGNCRRCRRHHASADRVTTAVDCGDGVPAFASSCSAGKAMDPCTCHLCIDTEAGMLSFSGSAGYLLLEQWTIAVQPEARRGHAPCVLSSSTVAATAAGFVQPAAASPAAAASVGGAPKQPPQVAHTCSLADLVQAVKSHLFFSQLSAWLQMSQGRRPRHVVYRLTAPGEWFRHSFASEPVSHSFPLAAAGKRHVVRVSLASLSRTELSAAELCAAEARRGGGGTGCPRHGGSEASSSTSCSVRPAASVGSRVAGSRQQPQQLPRRCLLPAEAASTSAVGDAQLLRSLQQQTAETLIPCDHSAHVTAGSPDGRCQQLQQDQPPPSSHRGGISMRLQPRSLSCLNKMAAASGTSYSFDLSPSGCGALAMTSSRLSSADNASSLPTSPCQQQQQRCSNGGNGGGALSSSGWTLERMGAFGEAGPRSLSELKLIGCSVGETVHMHPVSPQFPVGSRSCQNLCQNPSRCWNREPASAEAALASSGHTGHAVPPKSPKVLFSSWIKDARNLSSTNNAVCCGISGDLLQLSLPPRASATSPDVVAADRGSSSSSSRSGGSCRMRLSFDDVDVDDDEAAGCSCSPEEHDVQANGAVRNGGTSGEPEPNCQTPSSASASPGGTEKELQLPSLDASGGACFRRCHPTVTGDSGVTRRSVTRPSEQRVFDVGVAAAAIDASHCLADVSGGRRRDSGQTAAAAASRQQQRPSGEPATTSEATRLRRSGESFPTFSKLRLNDRPTFSSQSSPAPVKKLDRRSFHFDAELAAGGPKAIKSTMSCGSLASHCAGSRALLDEPRRVESSSSLSTSAPAAAASLFSSPTLPSAALAATTMLPAAGCTPSSALLGNFEETLLNGRIEPAGMVDGFSIDLGASGSFCPQHVRLPVKAYFFGSLSDDNAPSPYLGYVDLQSLGKRGYHVPRKGTLQVTLFNPNNKVVKMFVVLYDLEDMPSRSQTFLRQRTVYAPTDRNGSSSSSSGVDASSSPPPLLPTHLRYLIHMRFATSKTGKLYVHTDLRLIFARDKFEYDARAAASYEMRSYTEAPSNPKFSPFS